MAYVLSSVSGNLISAASAGYAPTNSADVSAIASAYQVVSSTATQLYAGTSYVTSVNETPISASRAGNAANASLANSAWYDGTGRFISALPDSATVSAIASSYAESAASSKLDESATADFYSTSNPSGFITSVDLTNYATTSYVDSSVSSKLDATASSQFLTSVPSEYATTTYVDSSVSSKLDSTASSQFLTSTAGLVGTGDLTAYAYESSNSAKLDTTAFSTVSSQFLTGLPADLVYTADISGFAYESAVSAWTAKQDALTFGYDSSNNISSIDGSALAGGGGGLEYGATAANGSNKIGLGSSGTGTKTDAGLYLSSTHGTGFYKVNEMTLNHSGYAETVKFNLGSAGSQVLLSASGTIRGAFHSAWNASASASFGVSGKSAYLKLGEYTAYDTSIDAWNGTYGTVANNSATWGGSSLQISAGAGISLSVVGNVLVISTAV